MSGPELRDAFTPHTRRADARGRRAAALAIASVALDLPGEARQVQAASEVLGALGYRTREQVAAEEARRVQVIELRRRVRAHGVVEVSARAVPARRHSPGVGACGEDRGSERGYRRHLSSYNVPCGDCLRWRTDQLAERWQRLGVNPESEVVLPS